MAKRHRRKYEAGADEAFYAEFFRDEDRDNCERDLRRVVREEEVSRVVRTLDAGAVVIDAGCGIGDVLQQLRPDVRRVGLDFSCETLKRARTVLPPDVGLVTGSSLALPLADGAVDAAICLEVLEHLQDDRAAVAELARVVKPGGLLVASVPSAFYFPDYLPLMGHWRHYSTGDFAELLAREGFQVQSHLCTYPKLNRVSFYVYCTLWVMNFVLTRVTRRRGTLYEMRLPFSSTPLYTQLLPWLRSIARTDDAAPPVKDTFVAAVRA